MKQNFNFSLKDVTGSTKIKRAWEIVTEISDSEKIIIFTYFSSGIQFIQEYFRKKIIEENKDFEISVVSGRMNDKKKNLNYEKFEKDKKTKILITTFGSSGEGLNLFHANNVILMDIWWNYKLIEQLIARCHRQGQKKRVKVWRLLIKNSVECRMKEVCEEKKQLTDNFKNILFSQNPEPGKNTLIKIFEKEILDS